MNDIRKMDIDQLKAFKSRLESTLHLVDERIQGQILSECSICEKPEFAYDDIPKGWKWAMDYYLLCPSCLEKFNRIQRIEYNHIQNN